MTTNARRPRYVDLLYNRTRVYTPPARRVSAEPSRTWIEWLATFGLVLAIVVSAVISVVLIGVLLAVGLQLGIWLIDLIRSVLGGT